jgi:hypothetical protein
MSDADRERYEEHFFSCAECADEVRTAAAFLEHARGPLTSGAPTRTATAAPVSRPAPTRAAWYRSAMVPWALAASLLLFSGHQWLVVVPDLREQVALIPGLREQIAPRGLYPITLRPESRGQVPRIPTASPAQGYTLAPEVNGVQPGAILEYKVATVSGRQTASDRVLAPPSGVPLELWVPVSVLEELTRYELSLYDAGSGQLVGVYRFERTN